MSSESSTMDSTHPLYLHPSDTQSMSLVPQVLTRSHNYTVWSRAMKLALRCKNKLGFIDGSLKRDADKKLTDHWDRCNAVVLSWLINSVDKEIANGMVFSDSAESVWLDLQEWFNKVDGSRIFSLHKALSSFSQGTLTVTSYFTKLKELWDEYSLLVPLPTCKCSTSQDYVKIVQQQRLFQFLMGLNDVHQQARSQILLISPLPTVNHAYSMICQDEEHRLISSQASSNPFDSAATTTRGRGPQGKGRGRGRSNDECTHCQRKGHTRE